MRVSGSCILVGFVIDELPSSLVCYGYASVFICAAVIVASKGLYEHFEKWTQRIRDAEFLLELRLANIDDAVPPPTDAVPPPADIDVALVE